MWRNRDVISILDFSREDIEYLFEAADKIYEYLINLNVPRLLEGKVISLAFFEPSTRTRLSF